MKKFVVLFNGVGSFNQGDVIEEKNLDAGNIDRLVKLGAIREANKEEAGLEKVEVIRKNDRHATYETQLAEKSQQIADLKAKIAQLEKDNQALKAAIKPHTPEPPTPAVADILAEKERQIKQLQAEKANAEAKAKK